VLKKPPSPLVLLGTVVLSVLKGAEASGTPLPRAIERALSRPQDEFEEGSPLLLVPPRIDPTWYLAQHRSHRSHSSHRSHYSGRSSHANHYSGSYSPGRSSDPVYDPAPAPPPTPPRPASVSLVAYPGGRIYVDGRLVGTDATGVLTLQPGAHQVRVENAFAGDTTTVINVTAGQTGVVRIEW
jgi:hypothetical protein